MFQSTINFLNSTGIAALITNAKDALAAGATGFNGVVAVIGTPLMLIIACVLLYLAIVKEFEPLLLLPIAFGMLLSNLPMFANSGAIMMHPEFFTDSKYFVDGHLDMQMIFAEGGLLDMLYLGVKLGIYPPLIFLGIGCMTDFGPLIANPKSILLGSAGVSAVPMAARVSQMVGQKENPSNFLLMHAMGPNVAGVIGSAVAAGVFLSMFAH